MSANTQTVFLGIFFLILVTTYSSFSFIITYIFTHDEEQYTWKGPLTLVVNYFTYFVVLTFTPMIKNEKKMFFLAALSYSLNYALEIPQIKGQLGVLLSVVGSISGGAGAAVLWVSQGGFMMKLFITYGITIDHRGKLYGIQNSIIYGHQLLGAVVTTFALGFFGNKVYFSILTGIGLFAAAFSVIFLENFPQEMNSKHIIAEQQASLNSESNRGHWFKIKKTLKKTYLYYPKMKSILSILFMGGFMLGFLSSYITNLIPQKLTSKLVAGQFLMIQGVGAVIAGFSSGKLSDIIQMGILGRISLLMVSVNLLLIYLCSYSKPQTLVFPFICSFVWGIADNFLEGWSIMACSKVFNNDLQSFAITKQMHTISYIVFQLMLIAMGGNLNLSYAVIILLIFCVVGFIMLGTLKIYSKQQESGANRQQIQQFSD